MLDKCIVPGCGRKTHSKNMCSMHYVRCRKYGSPYGGIKHKNKDNFNEVHKREYYSWCSMNERCHRKAHKMYKYYGGKGIKVCERWAGADGFRNFMSDMGERPEGYTLDRINTDKDYSPDNCRWASIYVQNSNRSCSNHVVGVSYDKQQRNYRASITVNTVRISKKFKSLSEAVSQRKAWEKEFGIEYPQR